MPHHTITTLCLVGHPNVGKSSLINRLAKGDLRTGNWPGVTVERTQAEISHQGQRLRLVDLPGIEDLLPSDRKDHQVTLAALQEHNGPVLCVMDSTELADQLPLALSLIAQGHQLGIYLTRLDQLDKRGGQLNLQALGRALRAPVWGEASESRNELFEAWLGWPAQTSPPQPSTPEALLKQANYRPAKADSLTERMDRWALHPRWGLVLFALVFYLLFKLTFDLSMPLVDWADGFVTGFVGAWLLALLNALGAPALINSLLADGIIPGLGLVVSFVPLLAVLYLLLGVLEQSGYLMRANRLLNRHMQRVGLPGAGLIPLLLGFGCNVPAVYALRTIEAEEDRRRVAKLLPFVSCSAKLPIYLFFALVFFPGHAALVIASLYLVGIVLLLLWARLLGARTPQQESSEPNRALPSYHWPGVQVLWRATWQKVKSFLSDAGSVIALSMLAIWALTQLPYEAGVEDSLLAQLARLVSPLFAPLGLGEAWRAAAAIMPGFVAKEVVVGTLGQLYASTPEMVSQETPLQLWTMLSDQFNGLLLALQQSVTNLLGTWWPGSLETEAEILARNRLRESFSPLTAYVFMLFNLLLISCFAHMGAIRQEFGARFMFRTVARTVLSAYGICLVVYQVGSLLW